jgi:hypothetical protein
VPSVPTRSRIMLSLKGYGQSGLGPRAHIIAPIDARMTCGSRQRTTVLVGGIVTESRSRIVSTGSRLLAMRGWSLRLVRTWLVALLDVTGECAGARREVRARDGSRFGYQVSSLILAQPGHVEPREALFQLVQLQVARR